MKSASKTNLRSARRAAEAGRRGDFGDIKSLLLSELQEQLRNLGEPSYRAGQIVDWLYKKRVDTIEKMTNLPRPLRSRLSEKFSLGKIDIVRVLGAHDTTRKFLFRLADGNLIESVLIPAIAGPLRWESGPSDDLCLDPGGLRLRMQILRERLGRFLSQSERKRNCRPAHRS